MLHVYLVDNWPLFPSWIFFLLERFLALIPLKPFTEGLSFQIVAIAFRIMEILNESIGPRRPDVSADHTEHITCSCASH